ASVLSGMPLWQVGRAQCAPLPRLINSSTMLLILLAQAQPAAPGAAGPNPLASFIPIILIFIIMYFVLFRPQMRRAKEQRTLVSALKTGDRVVTAAGIHGMITNVKDTTVTVKVADNVKIEMEKSAVSTVLKADTDRS
ncbi:MAG: preprotein translocase subunit YajC, partial [Spartobacteria bacterium]